MLLLTFRAPRLPQTGSVPRQRMKRPMQQSVQVQPQNNAVKQRRMDVLLPDRNEDADCHVIAQQKRNDGLPVIQNVQGATTQQTNRNDSTIHLTDSITLSVRQPGKFKFTYQSLNLLSMKNIFLYDYTWSFSLSSVTALFFLCCVLYVKCLFYEILFL